MWPSAPILVFALCLAAVSGRQSTAQTYAAGEPPPTPEVTVVEHLGERVSPDTEFVNSEGEVVRMGDFLGGDRPVVLAFAYHTCPMLCSLVLDGLAGAVAETDLRPGADFEVVTLSFDHLDGPERAAAAKAKYIEGLRSVQPGIAEHWHFLTGEEEAIRTLTGEVGFGFEWDEATQQYAHNAILVFLSPDGTITRYLYGIQHNERDFRLAAVEAGRGTVGSTLDRFLLTCFQYDSTSRSYSLYISNIMKIGGGLVIVGLAAFFIPMWLRERKRGAGQSPWTMHPHLSE